MRFSKIKKTLEKFLVISGAKEANYFAQICSILETKFGDNPLSARIKVNIDKIVTTFKKYAFASLLLTLAKYLPTKSVSIITWNILIVPYGGDCMSRNCQKSVRLNFTFLKAKKLGKKKNKKTEAKKSFYINICIMYGACPYVHVYIDSRNMIP